VERRDAERAPQVVADAPLLAMLREQLRHTGVVCEAETHAPQPRDEARGAEALGEPDAPRREQAAGEPEGAAAEMEAAGVAHFERHTQQCMRRNADRAHPLGERA